MTPKEKAADLVRWFTWTRPEHEQYVAKEIAKTCVDEILAACCFCIGKCEKKYWADVKAEIENL